MVLDSQQGMVSSCHELKEPVRVAETIESACRVTAHFVPIAGQPRPKTTILMKFDASVLQRDLRLPSS